MGLICPWDVLSSVTFGHLGRLVRGKHCPWDVMFVEMFCPWDVLSCDVLSCDVLSCDVLS